MEPISSIASTEKQLQCQIAYVENGEIRRWTQWTSHTEITRRVFDWHIITMTFDLVDCTTLNYPRFMFYVKVGLKVKVDLYSASSRTPMRSDMDQQTTSLSYFIRKHTPGSIITHIRIANAWVQLTTHLSTQEDECLSCPCWLSYSGRFTPRRSPVNCTSWRRPRKVWRSSVKDQHSTPLWCATNVTEILYKTSIFENYATLTLWDWKKGIRRLHVQWNVFIVLCLTR